MKDLKKNPETANEKLEGDDLVLADNVHLDADQEVVNLHDEADEHIGV